MKYIICDFCGSNLDHGERCECESERNRKDKKINEYVDRFFSVGESGQLTISIGGLINE